MKRTFMAMTLLFGTLATARADVLPLSGPDAWTEALNIRAPASTSPARKPTKRQSNVRAIVSSAEPHRQNRAAGWPAPPTFFIPKN